MDEDVSFDLAFHKAVSSLVVDRALILRTVPTKTRKLDLSRDENNRRNIKSTNGKRPFDPEHNTNTELSFVSWYYNVSLK